jgi:hypothetical protein
MDADISEIHVASDLSSGGGIGGNSIWTTGKKGQKAALLCGTIDGN